MPLREGFLRIMTNLLVKVPRQMLGLGFLQHLERNYHNFAQVTIDSKYLNTETAIEDETGLFLKFNILSSTVSTEANARCFRERCNKPYNLPKLGIALSLKGECLT